MNDASGRRLDKETRRLLLPAVCDVLGDTPTYDEVVVLLTPSYPEWVAWLRQRLGMDPSRVLPGVSRPFSRSGAIGD